MWNIYTRKSHLPSGSCVTDTSLALCHGSPVTFKLSLRHFQTEALLTQPPPPAHQQHLPQMAFPAGSSGGTEHKCCAMPVGASLEQSYSYFKTLSSLEVTAGSRLGFSFNRFFSGIHQKKKKTEKNKLAES